MEMDLDWVEPGQLRPLKRAEYDRLVAGGAFEEEKVELVRGFLLRMSPQGPSHAGVVGFLAHALGTQVEGRARVRQHSPLAVSDDSEPEPDLAVVAGTSWHRTGHPTTAELVIEVSDSSLRKDRTVKADVYAASGIPEYWVVDLAGLRVEVLSEPSPSGYRQRQWLVGTDVLRSESLRIEITVSSIFTG